MFKQKSSHNLTNFSEKGNFSNNKIDIYHCDHNSEMLKSRVSQFKGWNKTTRT